MKLKQCENKCILIKEKICKISDLGNFIFNGIFDHFNGRS